MSLDVISLARAVAQELGLEPRDRAVLYALCEFVWDRKPPYQAWPSQGTLAEITGYSRQTVLAALGDLEAMGVIRSEQQLRSRGGYSSKLYTICLAAPTLSRDLTASGGHGVKLVDSAVSNLSTAVLIRNKPESKDRTTPLNPPVTPAEAAPQPGEGEEQAEREAELALRDIRREGPEKTLARVAPEAFRLWQRMKKAMGLRDRVAEAQAESLLEEVDAHGEVDLVPALRETLRRIAGLDSPPGYLANQIDKHRTARLARERQFGQGQLVLEEGDRVLPPEEAREKIGELLDSLKGKVRS